MPAKAVPPSAEVRQYGEFLASRPRVHDAVRSVRRVEDAILRRAAGVLVRGERWPAYENFALRVLEHGHPVSPSSQDRVDRGAFPAVGLSAVVTRLLRDLLVRSPAGMHSSIACVPCVQYDVADAAAFLRYLESLKPEELASDAALADFVGSLPDSFARRVTYSYLLTDPDDRLLNLFRAYREMSGEYARLGLSDKMRPLDKVVALAGERGLVEWVLKIRAGARLAGLVHDLRVTLPALGEVPTAGNPSAAYRKLAGEVFGGIESLLREGSHPDDAIALLAAASDMAERLFERLRNDPRGASFFRAVRDAVDQGRLLKASVRHVA